MQQCRPQVTIHTWYLDTQTVLGCPVGCLQAALVYPTCHVFHLYLTLWGWLCSSMLHTMNLGQMQVQVWVIHYVCVMCIYECGVSQRSEDNFWAHLKIDMVLYTQSHPPAS